MPNSRRKFLKAGVLAAVFAAVPLKTALGQDWKNRDGNPGDGSNPSLQNKDPLATYTKAAFVSYLNSVFQLSNGFSVIEVTLLKVDDMPAPKGGECFTLLFRGGSRALRQDTYTLVHPSLGSFKLLLVPAGTDEYGVPGYLATINRLSYRDALIPAPTRRSSIIQSDATPTPSPTTAAPNTITPSPPTIPPSPPATTKPADKPRPSRKKKPSWKGDDDDFDID